MDFMLKMQRSFFSNLVSIISSLLSLYVYVGFVIEIFLFLCCAIYCFYSCYFWGLKVEKLIVLCLIYLGSIKFMSCFGSLLPWFLRFCFVIKAYFFILGFSGYSNFQCLFFPFFPKLVFVGMLLSSRFQFPYDLCSCALMF